MDCKKIIYGGLVVIALLYLYKIFYVEAPPRRMVVEKFEETAHANGAHTESTNGAHNGSQAPTHAAVVPDANPVNQPVSASMQIGNNEQFAPVNNTNRTPSSCFPQKILTANELLPRDDSAAISDFSQDYPIGEGIQRGINYLSAGYHIGVNTVGQSLRNANRQLRGEPPNPQVSVSPWLNSTIGPDLQRRPLNGDMSCNGQQ